MASVFDELATDVAKYALGERVRARINSQVEVDGDRVHCESQDDRLGFPEDVPRLERKRAGFDLIENILPHSL